VNNLLKSIEGTIFKRMWSVNVIKNRKLNMISSQRVEENNKEVGR